MRDYRTEEERARDEERAPRQGFGGLGRRAKAAVEHTFAGASRLLSPNVPSQIHHDQVRQDALFSTEEALSPSGARLWGLLHESAARIGDQARAIDEHRARIAGALRQRRQGDGLAIAISLRLLTGLGFLLLGLAIARGGAVLDVPASASAAVSHVFLGIGAIMALAGTGQLVIGFAAGRFSNRAGAHAAHDLGHLVAAMLEQTQEALRNARHKLQENRSTAPDAGALDDVAGAHAAAEEAIILLDRVDVLLAEPGVEPSPDLRAYRAFILGEAAQSTGMASIFAGLGFVAGALFSAFLLINSGASGGQGTPVTGFAQHAQALAVVFAGLGLFALAGVVGAIMTSFGRGVSDKRLMHSFAAIRAAMAHANAPRKHDVAAYIDALAGVSRQQIHQHHHSGASLSENASAQSPQSVSARDAEVSPASWREPPDSSKRFVETGFQSAPKAWLTEEGVAPGRRTRPKDRRRNES